MVFKFAYLAAGALVVLLNSVFGSLAFCRAPATGGVESSTPPMYRNNCMLFNPTKEWVTIAEQAHITVIYTVDDFTAALGGAEFVTEELLAAVQRTLTHIRQYIAPGWHCGDKAKRPACSNFLLSKDSCIADIDLAPRMGNAS